MRIFLTTAIALALLAPAAAAQVFKLPDYAPREGRFLVAGQATPVELNVFGPTRVRAIYRPGSVLEETEELTAAAGSSLEFTPREAGLVVLEAYEVRTDDESGAEAFHSVAKLVVSVKFADGARSGLVVMILAGVVLFGGAFLSIRALQRDGGDEAEEHAS